jgi:hypothetical protein
MTESSLPMSFLFGTVILQQTDNLFSAEHYFKYNFMSNKNNFIIVQTENLKAVGGNCYFRIKLKLNATNWS